MREHTTDDGFNIQVFDSGYIDTWGVRIAALGFELVYRLNYFCTDSYGFNDPEDDSEAERIPWTDQEWRECLANEADEILEATGVLDMTWTVSYLGSDGQRHYSPELTSLKSAQQVDNEYTRNGRTDTMVVPTSAALADLKKRGLV